LRQRLVLILKLLVAAGLIVWLVQSGKIDFQQLYRLRQGWPWFLAALVPFGLVLFICACRWRLLLRAQGLDYSTAEAYSRTMIGFFFNQFLIGTTGGDLVKAYMVASEQPGRRSAAVMSVFVDRALGLLVLVAVAMVAIAFNVRLVLSQPWLKYLAVLVVSIFFGSLLCGYVFYSERVRSLSPVRWLLARLPFRGALRTVSQAVYVYKFHPREVRMSVLLSILVHLLIVLMHMFLACALVAGPVNWVSFFFLIPVAQIAMAIPVNPPGALGTGEWMYQTLLKLGAGIADGALICILQRLVNYTWALVGCTYYVRRQKKVAEAMGAARAAHGKDGGDEFLDRPGGIGPDEPAADGSRSVRPQVDAGARQA